MRSSILVMDDDPEILELVGNLLQREGYAVLSACDGTTARSMLDTSVDLIVLDLMLPDTDGLSFTQKLRQQGVDTPIIMLTAKLDENDKILGLELGADDYVTKPFSLRELTARVRAVLRRLEKSQNDSDVLHAGGITLDRNRRVVDVQERHVELTPTEFDLLATFLGTPGRVFSRLDLLEKIQGDSYEGYERTIDVHIRNLRAKIEQDPRDPQYIETVYGVGYRFAGK
ncbi:MAG: response regulator transcription factor [Caldilineaceae bacterium]|nr:response regulator transcription factor [Caldilineaceae bacterium]